MANEDNKDLINLEDMVGHEEGVTVSYGAHQPMTDQQIVGITVARARKQLQGSLNIDPAATANVNGEKVDETYVLASGDHLEFVKESGDKG